MDNNYNLTNDEKNDLLTSLESTISGLENEMENSTDIINFKEIQNHLDRLIDLKKKLY
jgi:hypothetical protein